MHVAWSSAGVETVRDGQVVHQGQSIRIAIGDPDRSGQATSAAGTLGLVRLADPVVAFETGRASGHAGSGPTRTARLHLVVSLADAVVALLPGSADGIADLGVRVLDVRLADAVVALLARGAGRAARPAVLQLDLDFPELGHRRLVGAAVAVLDLDLDEVVVAVVHLHPGVRVVHPHRQPCRLRKGESVGLYLDPIRAARMLRLGLAERHLGTLRESARGNRESVRLRGQRATAAAVGLARGPSAAAAAASDRGETGCNESDRVLRP